MKPLKNAIFCHFRLDQVSRNFFIILDSPVHGDGNMEAGAGFLEGFAWKLPNGCKAGLLTFPREQGSNV